MFRILMPLLLISSAAQADDWRRIESAPKDGTVIEIQNSFGIRPWYGLFKWDNKMPITTYACNGEPSTCSVVSVKTQNIPYSWVQVNESGTALDMADIDYLRWRPYHRHGAYVDPIMDLQTIPGYWQ